MVKLKPHEEHRLAAPKDVGFALVTVSTSRFHAAREGRDVPDESKAVAEELIRGAGYRVEAYHLVPDDPAMILRAVTEALLNAKVDVVVTMGGTGASPSDVTIETLRPIFDKELEGFGQVFRVLSYEEIGSAAFLSNATAGVKNGKVIFCLPGSPSAAKLALEKLILPEIGHLLAVVRGLRHGKR